MYNISAERSAGWAGLAFLVLAIGSTLFYGSVPPPANAGPAAIAAFLGAHHQAVLIGAWLGFPTAAFFLWFAVGVRAHLAHSPGLADGLPLYALSGAILSVGIALSAGAIQATLATAAVPADDLPGWWALYMLLSGPIISMATAIFIFAAAGSQRRHGSASQGLALFGYLAGFGSAVSSLSLFFSAGAMSPTGWATLLLGAGLLAIWIIATSIWLIRVPAVTAT